jgi:hypothetical protein
MNKEQLLIQDFMKNLCDNEYSKANSNLKEIVNEKMKTRVRKALKNDKKQEKKEQE